MALLKALTKADWVIFSDPSYEGLAELDSLIEEAQVALKPSLVFASPRRYSKKVVDIYKNSPFNYSIDDVNVGNQIVQITTITF